MRFDLSRVGLLSLSLLLAASSTAIGCTADAGSNDDSDEVAATSDPIVDINNSKVKRQSIGNCWLYATASWAESLAKSAPNAVETNMSESYWTYWHWFDQIANGTSSDEISTGGFFTTSAEIIARYGIVSEGSFIASEVNDEMSLRQKSALAKMNESLKNGALKTPEARRDRALVRRELDTAWELSPNVISQLSRVFGTAVSRTLDKSTISTAFTSIKRARDIKAMLRDPDTKQPYVGTLADAIGTRASTWSSSRTGRFSWQSNSYPTSPTSRRTLLARMQKALHDKQPVIMSWYVDFNALDTSGRFAAPPLTPGRQGGHMVVLEDYQINNVPGFGTLNAGVNETRPTALQAALDPNAKIEFLRVKNSWGSFRPDRQFVIPGYHDLYMKYLDGPIKECTPNEDDTGSTDDCWQGTPLTALVLPPGY